MRVAYLINQYPKVSHSFIRREILALERHGFEVMRIALRGWDLELVDPEDLQERTRTRYVLRDGTLALLSALILAALSRPARLFRATSLAWRMSRRSDRSLLVHLAYVAEACRIEAWLREAKIEHRIEHLHAHFGTNSADVAMLVNELGGPPWSFTVHHIELINNPRGIGLPEKIRHCAFVVAISSYGRAQLYRLVEHQHWPKIHLVHCGLDRAYHSVPATDTPAARRLVCVGRLCEEKGQLLLLQAAARLAADGTPFELVLAGDGELRGEIEAVIARRKLDGRVRITGWISGERVREEILAARALVLASFSEGIPVVIMEAMALRRPVIATFVGGIPELVFPGEHGWLVPAGDVEALAQAMRACLAAPIEMLARMGATAHERVLERHDVESEAEKLAALLRPCCAAPTRRQPDDRCA
jgi:glycosyltransferase involved in cell wall biosynthesis